MNVSSMQNGLEDATTLHPIHHSGTLFQTLLPYIRIMLCSIFYFMVDIVGNFTIILLSKQFLITSKILKFP